MSKTIKNIGFILALIVLLTSCSKDPQLTTPEHSCDVLISKSAHSGSTGVDVSSDNTDTPPADGNSLRSGSGLDRNTQGDSITDDDDDEDDDDDGEAKKGKN